MSSVGWFILKKEGGGGGGGGGPLFTEVVIGPPS